jgi:hypothetical protein
MTVSLVSVEQPGGRARIGAMVGAEVLKLRKRRGLFWSTLALTVGPMLVGYVVLSIQHAVDPERFGPAGSIENLRGSIDVLLPLATVAATLVGITAGGADVQAGVFRELVTTGRHRLTLFALRVAGGVAFLAPFVLAAVAVAAAASVALAGSEELPTAGLVLRLGAWVALGTVVALVLAIGVGSTLGGRVAIALVLGWHFAVSPILLQTGKLDSVLFAAALERLEPTTRSDSPSIAAATAAVAAWMLVPLVIGAWRTAKRDA